MPLIPLDLFDLTLASSLILIAAGLSVALDLGVTRSLLVAAARMTAQLTLIGVILIWLFATASPAITALATVLMLGFAAHEVRARQDRALAGWWTHGIGAGAMALSSYVVVLFALLAIVRPDPWHAPEHLLPLLGMILGNTMTGVGLGLRTLTNTVARDRAAIEARLMLGHDRRQALGQPVRDALRTALMPTINSMAAAGLVFLPGMMTGQILAGVSPEQAVKYQMLVYFLIAGGTALGAVFAVLATAARLTDARHRLRLDRLRGG